MKYIKEFTIAVGALLFGMWLTRACTGPTVIEKPTVVTTVDTVKVEIPITRTVRTPVVTTIVETKLDTLVFIPLIDTGAIVRDYYAKVFYRDTLRLDTIGQIILEDTIYRNRILTRNYYGLLNAYVINKTTTVTLPPEKRAQLYVGGVFTTQPTLGPSLVFKTKRDQLFSLGVQAGASGLNYNAGVYWKIRLKK